mmetsp:Transcript_5234/g.7575  ORF Transcript_5234/g.7575 Transcript_5234/m.7575 type:complete len:131 (-) Transcript_5234:381-773(-)
MNDFPFLPLLKKEIEYARNGTFFSSVLRINVVLDRKRCVCVAKTNTVVDNHTSLGSSQLLRKIFVLFSLINQRHHHQQHLPFSIMNYLRRKGHNTTQHGSQQRGRERNAPSLSTKTNLYTAHTLHSKKLS